MWESLFSIQWVKILTFFLFLHETLLCVYSLEVPAKALLMSTHNICLHGEIKQQHLTASCRGTSIEYPQYVFVEKKSYLGFTGTYFIENNNNKKKKNNKKQKPTNMGFFFFFISMKQVPVLELCSIFNVHIL